MQTAEPEQVNKLKIEVMSYDQFQLYGAKDLVLSYDIHRSPMTLLDMKFHIGMKSWDNLVCTTYDQVIDEYAVWLEDQIKAGNRFIMTALDEIFQKAQRDTVVLLDSIQPGHSRCAGTEVKRMILELAKSME